MEIGTTPSPPSKEASRGYYTRPPPPVDPALRPVLHPADLHAIHHPPGRRRPDHPPAHRLHPPAHPSWLGPRSPLHLPPRLLPAALAPLAAGPRPGGHPPPPVRPRRAGPLGGRRHRRRAPRRDGLRQGPPPR